MFHRVLQRKFREDVAANLLFADFRHGEAGHRYYAEAWDSAAKDSLLPGNQAYGFQQADMYRRRADDFRSKHDSCRSAGVDYETIDHGLVSTLSIVYTEGFSSRSAVSEKSAAEVRRRPRPL